MQLNHLIEQNYSQEFKTKEVNMANNNKNLALNFNSCPSFRNYLSRNISNTKLSKKYELIKNA